MALDHLAAIKSGTVNKSNVIGLRMAINANARRYRRLSAGRTAPKLSDYDLAVLEEAVTDIEPRVDSTLHDSGLKLLRDPRYKRRLTHVADIVGAIESFRLVGFMRYGEWDLSCTPAYKACAPCGSFTFINIPWQSGGDGPEVLRIDRR
jgi:hypothetical protein